MLSWRAVNSNLAIIGKQMNICIISPEFSTEASFSGGLAQHFYRIAKHLASTGHSVHIIVYSTATHSFEQDGILIHRIESNDTFIFRMLNTLTANTLRPAARWLCFSYHALKTIQKLSRNVNFDVVHCPNSYGCGLFTLLFTKIPHVIIGSCYRPAWSGLSKTRKGINLKLIEIIESIYYRAGRNVYTPSAALKQMLSEKLQLKNISVIPTPFYVEVPRLDDTTYKSILAGKNYLLYYGKLQLHKGVHVLAAALARVFDKNPGLYCVFAGKDTSTHDIPSVKELIISLCGDHADRLIFIDQIPHERLYPVITHARAVVLPSLVDNLPNTCLEAMGSGKIVIGTIGCSFDEIIEDGKTGFLIHPDNPSELSDKINHVLGRDDLSVIESAAQLKIDEYNPEKTVGMLLDYYRKAVK